MTLKQVIKHLHNIEHKYILDLNQDEYNALMIASYRLRVIDIQTEEAKKRSVKNGRKKNVCKNNN